jgi:hypothetical protein
MGIRIKLAPHLIRLMDPIDQAKFGPTGPGLHPKDDAHPPPRTNAPEKAEQRHFANYCLLHNYAFIWHATHKPSTATPGTPDFIVAVNRHSVWIEFKAWGAQLSKPQEEFRARLEAQGITLYVVYTHVEAIQLIQQFDRVTL